MLHLRDRLALALDTDDATVALRWARDCESVFGYAKVGLELFCSAGPSIIFGLQEIGYRIFLDLKLHDIPNTVFRSSKVLGSYGVDLITVHASGGQAMMEACVDGLALGSQSSGLGATPKALGVTYLTSDSDVSDAAFLSRIELILNSGLAGFVSSAFEVGLGKQKDPTLIGVTPGIRLSGDVAHDQVRIATPRFAIDQGADLLVIGRSITNAPNLGEALTRLMAEIDGDIPQQAKR